MKTDPNSKEGMEPLITIAATKQLVDEMVPMGRTFNVYEVERALGMMRGTYEAERRADKARIKELEGLVVRMIVALKEVEEYHQRIAHDERVGGWVHQNDYSLYCLLADPDCGPSITSALDKAAELIPSNT